MTLDPLQLAHVQLTLDEQPIEELPGIAVAALESGRDTPTLRELAGSPRHEHERNRALFGAAMADLKADGLIEESAALELVRHWAAEIVSGAVEPYEGARLIWWRGWERLGRPNTLTAFVDLASDWEELPAQRAELEQKIVEAAERLLQ